MSLKGKKHSKPSILGHIFALKITFWLITPKKGHKAI